MFQDSSSEDSLSSEEISSSEDNLTIPERQFRLNDASKRYFEGEISEGDLRRIEEKLEVDYAQAALDQTSVRAEIVNALQKWVRSVSNRQGKHKYYRKNDISTTENR